MTSKAADAKPHAASSPGASPPGSAAALTAAGCAIGALCPEDEDAGTYDVTYDDGEVEKGVKQENIARAPGDSELEVGARIEAKYKGKKKYYPGKIARRGDNGTYDIAYDDGEEESGVARNLIREA